MNVFGVGPARELVEPLVDVATVGHVHSDQQGGGGDQDELQGPQADPGCCVLQVKPDFSSPQTLSAATTSTRMRKMKSTESQMRPMPVEWRLDAASCLLLQPSRQDDTWSSSTVTAVLV
ncbi:unnamed protein product [Menidia menidia]|uniref:(Atlantic silverside) hypothetical protein n=1 Tax=Menidia menidia TaxID=238744 RepID=A0A8S4ASG7_9TELE|nr:unnamed protein product [Menidia menidia]